MVELLRIALQAGRQAGLRADRRSVREDASAGSIRAAQRAAVARFNRQAGTRLRVQMSQVASAVDQHSAQQTARSLASLGAPLGARSPAMNQELTRFVGESVSRIKGLTPELARQIEQRVVTAVQRGYTQNQLRINIMRRIDVTWSRAEMIARDQVQKAYARMNQARQEAAGIKTYRWGPTDSEVPRELHEEYRGQVFEWSDPPFDGHPGEAINCGCVAIPVVQ